MLKPYFETINYYIWWCLFLLCCGVPTPHNKKINDFRKRLIKIRVKDYINYAGIFFFFFFAIVYTWDVVAFFVQSIFEDVWLFCFSPSSFRHPAILFELFRYIVPPCGLRFGESFLVVEQIHHSSSISGRNSRCTGSCSFLFLAALPPLSLM